MRLLTITHYTALLGANRSLLHLLEGLRDRHDVELLVLCPRNGPFTAALEQRHIPFRVIPFANWAYTIRSLGLWLFPWKWWRHQHKALPAALEIAREFNPDLIHSNTIAVSLGWQLAEALQKPHCWHVREFGWADYQLVFPLGKTLFFRQLNRAARVIFISRAMRTAFESQLTAPAAIIYNGIGRLEFLKNLEITPGSGSETVQFLIIGLLHPNKGQHQALAAFARIHRQYPGARLTIAGNGRKLYLLRLRFTAWWHGLSAAVSFTGYVNDPASLYRQADIVLMCSKKEGMGRVTAEAMAWGKPVIGFRGGATPELIQDGENGLLYDTTESLADKMLQLIRDDGQRARLGAQARAVALTRFSDEGYVDGVFEALKALISP